MYFERSLCIFVNTMYTSRMLFTRSLAFGIATQLLLELVAVVVQAEGMNIYDLFIPLWILLSVVFGLWQAFRFKHSFSMRVAGFFLSAFLSFGTMFITEIMVLEITGTPLM